MSVSGVNARTYQIALHAGLFIVCSLTGPSGNLLVAAPDSVSAQGHTPRTTNVAILARVRLKRPSLAWTILCATQLTANTSIGTVPGICGPSGVIVTMIRALFVSLVSAIVLEELPSQKWVLESHAQAISMRQSHVKHRMRRTANSRNGTSGQPAAGLVELVGRLECDE